MLVEPAAQALPLGPGELQHAADLVEDAQPGGALGEEPRVRLDQRVRAVGARAPAGNRRSAELPELLERRVRDLADELFLARKVEVERPLRDLRELLF